MTCAPSASRKALFVWSANNKSWICLQRVLAAVRRLRIIRFFVICVMTTSVLKIVILKNTLDHGRNFDLLLRQIYTIGYLGCWVISFNGHDFTLLNLAFFPTKHKKRGATPQGYGLSETQKEFTNLTV
jgi:hypothetical protein